MKQKYSISTLGVLVIWLLTMVNQLAAQSVNLNIGTLPPGKSVTITFKVEIKDPVPNGVCAVSNQGTVSGSNFSSVLTDDPDVAGSANPTITPITLTPCTISGPDPVCAGSTGNSYTASSDIGGATFNWSISGNGTLSASTGSSVSVNAGGAGTYTLTATASSGSCSTTCTKTATVNASPTCTISGPDPVCSGLSGNMYTVASSEGGASFSWAISGIGSITGSTTGSSVSVDAGVSGSYTLTVTSSLAGCTSTCTKTVTIQNPACTISGPDPVCAASSGHTYTVSSNTGGTTFSWSISAGGTIVGSTTGSSVSVTAGSAGSYTLTVTSTTPASCTATCTKTVTVSAVPSCTISGPDAVCSGVAGNGYTASSSVEGATFAWSISGNGTISGSTTGSSISVNAGASGSYTLTVTAAIGSCSSTCTKTVTVNQTPACSISGPDPVCAGATRSYSVGTVSGYALYSWSISGSGSLGATTGSSVNVTAGSAGSYTLTVTATTTGCTSTCTKTATIENPACTISGPDAVCVLSTNTFTASSATSANFSWSINGNGTISGTSTGSSVPVNANSSGSFTLTVTSTTPNGCTATCTKIVSIENPGCTISGPAPVCGSTTNTYTALIAASASFSWAVSGDGSISGSTAGSSVSVIAGSSGSYTLTVTSETSGGCTSTCSTTITVNPVPSCTISGPDPVNGGSTNTYTATSSVPYPSFSWSVAGSGTISGTTTGSSVSVVAGGCGSYTLTVTVSKAGCSNTCTQTVTVHDVTPPTITGISVNPATLWPPSHKMRDVTVNYTATDNCGGTPTCVLSVTSNEPINGTGDGDTAPDWIVVDAHHVQLRAERAATGDGRVYTITITCADASGNSSDTTVTVVVAHNITDPPSGSSFKIGTSVNFAGTFWDVPGNKHTAQWTIDNLSTKGSITEPSGFKNGKVTGSNKFSSTGVYKVQLNITDQNGVTSYVNTQGDLEAIVVIYDPNAGYAVGGGWFTSPAGAYLPDMTLTGKASFGFTSSYYKNATNPKGETQFQFAQGNLDFNALNFDYLSISGAKAVFKGHGKIGLDASYNFILTAIDGQLPGGGGVDKIRMKIWNKTTGALIYDSQPGASDADDPITPVGDGSSIVIVTTKASSSTATGEVSSSELAAETLPTEYALYQSYPNPFNPSTQIQFDLPEDSRVKLVIFDILGREIVTLVEGDLSAGRYRRTWEGRDQGGRPLSSGIYFMRMTANSLTSDRHLISLKKMALIR